MIQAILQNKQEREQRKLERIEHLEKLVYGGYTKKEEASVKRICSVSPRERLLLSPSVKSFHKPSPFKKRYNETILG
jgi:hypothetical protein